MIFFLYFKSIFCSSLIAITYIFGKKLGSATSSEILALLRFVVSTLCFLPFINLKELKNLTLINSLLILLGGFFGIFLYNNLFFLSLKYTVPINIALVNSMIPMLTLAFSSLIYFKIPSKKQTFAFLLSFIGVVLVITKGVFTTDILKTTSGELIMLIAAISWVFYGFIIRAITKDFSPLFTTFITGFAGTIMLLTFSFYKQTISSINQLTTNQWFYISYIGSLGAALVFFLYTDIIKKSSPAFTNFIIFSSTPILVALISYFFLAIPLTLWQLIGGGFVLSALVLNAK